MKAAARVGALRTPRTVETPATFIDEPNLQASDIGPFDGAMHEFVEEEIERTFLGHLEEQMACEIGVKPAVRDGSHNEQGISEARSFKLINTENRIFILSLAPGSGFTFFQELHFK